jgi:hypothetical protein
MTSESDVADLRGKMSQNGSMGTKMRRNRNIVVFLLACSAACAVPVARAQSVIGTSGTSASWVAAPSGYPNTFVSTVTITSTTFTVANSAPYYVPAYGQTTFVTWPAVFVATGLAPNPAPLSCTAKNLAVSTPLNAGVANFVVTLVRAPNASTALTSTGITCSFTGSGAWGCIDTTHTYALTAGDVVEILITNSTGNTYTIPANEPFVISWQCQ